jgi:hypothetical protein
MVNKSIVFTLIAVFILLTMPASIPAVLIQAYNMGLTRNHEYAFITVDFIPGEDSVVCVYARLEQFS